MELGGNLAAGFIVGGHSAGGQNARVVSQLAVDRQLEPPVTGSFLMIASLLAEEILSGNYKTSWTSRVDNAHSMGFNAASIEDINRTWSPDLKSPLYSPFNSEKAQVGYSPTYIQVCDLDPLRDDGIVYEKVLRDHGVETKMDVLPDTSY